MPANPIGHDIIVIGASAGGVQALTELCRGLPADLPAAVFVVIHTAPTSPGILPQILDRAGPLVAEEAADGEVIRPRRIYVSRPDHHLLIKSGRVAVTRGPRENGFRPAVDPLFRTAARVYGPRVIGVVLSGGLDDGTEGLTLIKRHGGLAVVQDPEEAVFPGMPASAIQHVEVDHVLPIAGIPGVLAELARQLVPEGALTMIAGNGKDVESSAEQDIAEVGDNALLSQSIRGAPSSFTCPECGGAVWELHDGKLIKYRCHVGHSYTPEGLVAAQSDALESALWSALRALEESAEMRRRMARRAARGNWPTIVQQYEQQAAETESRAGLIRSLLLSGKTNDGHQAAVVQETRRDAAIQKRNKTRQNGRTSHAAAGPATAGNGRKAKVVPAAAGKDVGKGRGAQPDVSKPQAGSRRASASPARHPEKKPGRHRGRTSASTAGRDLSTTTA